MTNTKKSLLTSAVSMLLCVAMLLGTTFAWFTDNATNTGNRILAGNLEVDLLMHNGTGYESIKDGSGDIFAAANTANNSNETLWEPGKTQIVYLGVENDGNLALKYEIMLNVTDRGLIGALEYAIIDGAEYGDITATNWGTLQSGAQTGDVKAGITMAAENGKLSKGDTDYFALAVHMKEDAGNEYMDKDIIIDVAVNATQLDEEEDSFGTDYDAGIAFDESNRAKLPARAEEKVAVTANKTTETVTTLSNNDNVEAVIPEGVLVDETAIEDGEAELVLSITRTDVPEDVTVAEDEAATAVEIEIAGISEDNTTPIVIEVKGLFAKNLNNVKLYHHDDLMTKVGSAVAVANHNEFYYDATTGTVTLATATFSPFTMVADVEGVALPKALVEEITDTVTVDGYTLDKAYVFKTTQDPEEVKGLPYENWNADFVISFDKDIKAETLGVAGYYESWCKEYNDDKWLGFVAPEDIKAGQAIRLLNSYNIGVRYSELCDWVKEFKCGAFDIDGQNEGTTITVELRLYETGFDSTNSLYETGNSYLVGSFNYTF